MRSALAAFILAATVGLVWSGSASAVPGSPTIMNEAANSLSAVQEARYSKRRHRHRHGILDFYERRTRHGITKCYREFVIGRYVCRTYRYW
jgi:hypothetical protein